MPVRIKLVIEQEAYTALLRLALQELRNPESQIRFILYQELIILGLISNIDLNISSNKTMVGQDTTYLSKDLPYKLSTRIHLCA
jgi:hypothetical protein